MGYSKSIRAFNRVRKFLDEMVDKNEPIVWPSDDAATLAYNIREGIKVAKDRALDETHPNREAYNPFAALGAKFIVRVKGLTVVAEPRDFSPQLSANTALNKMTIDDVVGPLEIVGAAIKHKAQDMFFPDADLTTEDLVRVYTWSSKHDYFIVYSDVGVTLTKTDPGEIAWHPSSPTASS